MHKTGMKCVVLLALALAAPHLSAQGGEPNAMPEAVTLEVITAMKQERDRHGGNPKQVASLIETKVLPLFDFQRMTQIALARKNRQGDSRRRAPKT